MRKLLEKLFPRKVVGYALRCVETQYIHCMEPNHTSRYPWELKGRKKLEALRGTMNRFDDFHTYEVIPVYE